MKTKLHKGLFRGDICTIHYSI